MCLILDISGDKRQRPNGDQNYERPGKAVSFWLFDRLARAEQSAYLGQSAIYKNVDTGVKKSTFFGIVIAAFDIQ